MYTTISDFKEDWTIESEATLKIFNNLTDESLKQQVTPEGRSLGFLAWHITTSIGEMLNRVGLKTDSPAENATLPEAAAEIKAVYEKASMSVIEEILNNWTNETFLKEDDMYGEMWKRGKTLGVLVVHQIHHRAQMTILMRQAGLKVPGIYGPSKEEWAQFGMPALP